MGLRLSFKAEGLLQAALFLRGLWGKFRVEGRGFDWGALGSKFWVLGVCAAEPWVDEAIRMLELWRF